MAVLDLRTISFRSFAPVEGAPSPMSPPGGISSGALNLSAIKYRAFITTPATPPTPVGPPANDNLSSAIQLTGTSGSVSGDTTSGTIESANENSWVGGTNAPTVWYYWKNTTGVEQLFTTTNLSGDVLTFGANGAYAYGWPHHSGMLATGFDDIYSNSSQTSQTSDIVRNTYDRWGRINVPNGEIVYIQILPYSGASFGTFTFDWSTLAFSAPANDDFANAITLTGSSGTLQGTNEFATSDGASDPLVSIEGYGPRSVWYTIPSSGVNRLITLETDAPTSGIPMTDTVIGLYKGTTLAGLTLIARDDDSGTDNWSLLTSQSLLAGETGYVEVTGYGNVEASQGRFTLNWTIV